MRVGATPPTVGLPRPASGWRLPDKHVAQIHARWLDTRFTERRNHLGDDFAVVEWPATATRTDRRQIEWGAIAVIVLRDARICANYVYSSSRAPRVLDVENTA